jgi:hypothetical protein
VAYLTRAHILARRRLCDLLGRSLEGCASFSLTIAISVARSRAATVVNFARTARASNLRTALGAAKSCSTVIFFKSRPQRL